MRTAYRYASLLLALSLLLTPPIALAKQKPASQSGQSRVEATQKADKGGMTARQAAAQAQARHGGKVLKVSRNKGGYKVRLLQDSGRVITVQVKE
jgi:starvation-inducible outer membrane lipoprotein